jgi:hypothetical protein
MSAISPSEQLIHSRLNLVDLSTGSIVAVASWIALHAAAADRIFSVWCDRMTSKDASDETRIALLYLAHEVVLCCQSRSVPDRHIKVIQTALVTRCGPGFAAAARTSTSNEFKSKLAQVLQWWSALQILPPSILREMKTNCFNTEFDQFLQLSTTGGRGGGAGAAEVSPLIEPMMKYLKKYNVAKDKYRSAKTAGDQELVNETKEELERRIIALLKQVEGDSSSDRGSMLGTLRTELEDLRGEGPPTTFKTETNDSHHYHSAAPALVADPLADLFE